MSLYIRLVEVTYMQYLWKCIITVLQVYPKTLILINKSFPFLWFWAFNNISLTWDVPRLYLDSHLCKTNLEEKLNYTFWINFLPLQSWSQSISIRYSTKSRVSSWWVNKQVHIRNHFATYQSCQTLLNPSPPTPTMQSGNKHPPARYLWLGASAKKAWKAFLKGALY